MSFSQNYIGLNSNDNVASTRNRATEEQEGQVEEKNESIKSEIARESLELQSDLSASSTGASSEELNPKKRKKSSSTEVIAEPMAVYLKSVTQENKKQEEEDPVLYFFKSLLPDVNKLISKRQRKFKANVLQTLNTLLDEQDDEIKIYSPRPPSVYSIASSNHSTCGGEGAVATRSTQSSSNDSENSTQEPSTFDDGEEQHYVPQK